MKKEDLKSPDFKHSQSVKTFRIGGRDYNRVACGYEVSEWYGIEDDCSNCGVATGFLHFLPCDLEQCPRCHEQALGCRCDYEKRPDQLRQNDA
jgi:hypothetical protein